MKTIIALSLTLLVYSCGTTEVKTEIVDTTKIAVDTTALKADTASVDTLTK